MARKKYWSIYPILEYDAEYNAVLGARTNGKSYGIKEFLLKEVWKDHDKPESERKGKFCYIRRYKDDLQQFLVYGWLKDMVCNKDKKNTVKEITNGKYNDFKIAKNGIWFANFDKEGKETEKPYLVGRYINIGDAERWKSQSMLDFDYIVMEEFLASSKPYLPNEPAMLESLVSTIARERKIKVFLIGNTESRTCPYFEYFGLEHIKRQKVGTIDCYEFETGEYKEDGTPLVIKFAVEYVGEISGSNGMFFGIGKNNVGAQWSAKKQPLLTQEELNKYECIYDMYFEWHGLKWRCELYIGDMGEFFWYVKPFNKQIYDPYARVISDKVSINPYHTINLKPLNKCEQAGFDVLINGKVFFCDSLTGTEFKRAFDAFQNAILSSEF